MSNSTYLAATNKVLELAGQRQISSAASFDAPTTALSRVQQLARAYVDLASRFLLTKLNKRFMQREFTFGTDSMTLVYTLDPNIDSESLVFHSFFFVDQGQVAPIRNWDYREFRALYPDDDDIPTGIPNRWILLPIAGQSNEIIDPTHAIMFYPRPDAIYTIRYQAKLNAQPLSLSTDKILFPPEYEHSLWLQGRLFLEQILGEGKDANIERFASQAASEVNMWADGPEEVRHAVKIGIIIGGVARGRRVSRFFTSGDA